MPHSIAYNQLNESFHNYKDIITNVINRSLTSLSSLKSISWW